MIDKKLEIPRTIWTSYKLFKETIIQESTLLEVTYDEDGLRKCHYRVPSGGIYAWVREYLDDTKLFETKEQAINAVKDGNYSINYINKTN